MRNGAVFAVVETEIELPSQLNVERIQGNLEYSTTNQRSLYRIADEAAGWIAADNPTAVVATNSAPPMARRR